MDRESQLVDRIARALSFGKSVPSGLRLGIGDDAAILSLLTPPPHKEWVLSCDAFLEGPTFPRENSSPGFRRLQSSGPRHQ